MNRTIPENLEMLEAVKTGLATKINEMGGEITSSTPFSSYKDELPAFRALTDEEIIEIFNKAWV